MGGGGSSTTVQNIPPWIEPYATRQLDRAEQVSQRPYTPFTGQRYHGLTGAQVQGIQGAENLAGGTPGLWAADQMLGETLSGQGMNPYLDMVADRVVGDATKGYYNATAGNLSRFTGDNHNSTAYQGAQDRAAEDFSRGMGDSLSSLFAQGYQNERGNQMQAASQMPGLLSSLSGTYKDVLGAGTLQQQDLDKNYDFQYQQWLQGQNWPEHQLDVFGNTVSSLLGGAGHNTQTQTDDGGAGMMGTLGTMAMAAAMFFSDRRLKSDIALVGVHPTGIGVYEYDKFGHRERGVMADEVELVKPEAVATHPSGYKMVNYGMLQ